PTDIRSRVDQREDILELIAESERAARLIRPAPRPDAATECLIHEPSIHQEIEGIVGRMHLNDTERVVPEVLSPRQGVPGLSEVGVTDREIRRMTEGVALSQHERDLPRFARLEVDGDLQRRAWIEACADTAGQPTAEQSGRRSEVVIASDKVGAIAGERARRLRGVPERDTI